MSRLEEFKGSLAGASEYLDMASDCIDEALADISDNIGIRSNEEELLEVQTIILELMNKLDSLQVTACY